MTQLLLNANWNKMHKRTDEISELLPIANEYHGELVRLEQIEQKNYQDHVEILKIRKYLEAQVRDFPELTKQLSTLARYAA